MTLVGFGMRFSQKLPKGCQVGLVLCFAAKLGDAPCRRPWPCHQKASFLKANPRPPTDLAKPSIGLPLVLCRPHMVWNKPHANGRRHRRVRVINNHQLSGILSHTIVDQTYILQGTEFFTIDCTIQPRSSVSVQCHLQRKQVTHLQFESSRLPETCKYPPS